MAQHYEMLVVIDEVLDGRGQAVRAAAEASWLGLAWNWLEDGPRLESRGRGFLEDDDAEDAFAHRIARAIWEANGTPCYVSVNATPLDDLPHRNYYFANVRPPNGYEARRGPH